jgi:hypothetical protein
VIALIIAASICSVLIIAVTSLAYYGRPIGEAGGAILNTCIGALIGVLASYFSGKAEAKKDEPPQ